MLLLGRLLVSPPPRCDAEADPAALGRRGWLSGSGDWPLAEAPLRPRIGPLALPSSSPSRDRLDEDDETPRCDDGSGLAAKKAELGVAPGPTSLLPRPTLLVFPRAALAPPVVDFAVDRADAAAARRWLCCDVGRELAAADPLLCAIAPSGPPSAESIDKGPPASPSSLEAARLEVSSSSSSTVDLSSSPAEEEEEE